MRRIALLPTISALAICAGALFGASSASATVLCKTATDPCISSYAKGTVIEASLKSGTKSKLNVGFEFECEEGAIKAEVTNPGPETVSGSVSSFSFGKCSGSGEPSIEVLKNGTFSIGSPSGGNGALTLEGFEFKVSVMGVECIFGGSGSASLSGGEMAAFKVSASLPKKGGSKGEFLCKEQAEWSAEYTVTAPEPLYVESKQGSVLCKTASNPCSGGTYGEGTAVEASLKSGTKSKLAGGQTVECEEAAIKGKLTNSGSETASGPVSSLSFGKCSNTVTVLKSGTFSVDSPSNGNGVLRLEGFEITANMAGVSCTYGSPAVTSLSGGEMAAIGVSALLPKTGGGFLCAKQAEWSAEYTVTAPEPLYVEAS